VIARRPTFKSAPLLLFGLSGAIIGLVLARVTLRAELAAELHVSALWWLLGGALLGFAVGFVSGAVRIKSALSAVQPGTVSFTTIDAEAAAGPLADRLHAMTETLESLGFVRQRDYGVALPGRAAAVRGFARVFFHPQHRCFAEVNAAAGQYATIELGASLMTILSEGWTISAWSRFNPATAGINWVRRSPRRLWKIFLGAAPDQLLQEHLKMRDAIIADLGVSIVSDPLPQIYFDEIQRSSAEKAAAFRRVNIIAYLLDADLYALNPKLEWLGDYARRQRLRGS
jgi:hypothetical protein